MQKNLQIQLSPGWVHMHPQVAGENLAQDKPCWPALGTYAYAVCYSDFNTFVPLALTGKNKRDVFKWKIFT